MNTHSLLAVPAEEVEVGWIIDVHDIPCNVLGTRLSEDSKRVYLTVRSPLGYESRWMLFAHDDVTVWEV